MSQDDKVQFKVYITRRQETVSDSFSLKSGRLTVMVLLSSEAEQAIKQYIAGGDILSGSTHTYKFT